MEIGKMGKIAIQFRSFLGRTKVGILNFFKGRKDYRIKIYKPFLSTNEGIVKIQDEIKRLESDGYFSSHDTLDQLIQRANRERNLVEKRHENLAKQAGILFSLVVIITVIALVIINSNNRIARIQKHLDSNTGDMLITLVSLGLLLYLILTSISSLSLAVRNDSSGFWNKSTKIFSAGLELATNPDLATLSDQCVIKIQQYVIAKAVYYSVESTVRVNNYWRSLIDHSTEKLVRAAILVVFFSLYLVIPSLYAQIIYGFVLSIFLISTLIKDHIDLVYLIIALHKPEKKMEREMKTEPEKKDNLTYVIPL